MDGREAMAFYIQREMGGGGGGSGSGTQAGGLHGPVNMSPFGGMSLPVGGSSVGHGFSISMDAYMPPLGAGASPASGLPSGESVKKKRGRPRKYGRDGSVSLALSSSSPKTPHSTVAGGSQKRGRGRPPGSGKKQQLASLGEWLSSSAGMGFTPHVVTISIGEDIAAKIMSLSQLGPRAVCVLTASGSVSTVTLRQSDSFGGNVTYEGRFEILSLSGSFLHSDDGGSRGRGRTGGLSISLSGPDGRVIGGGVGELLIAATPVQVIVGSFNYGRTKTKIKLSVGGESGVEGEPPATENTPTPTDGALNQRLPPPMMGELTISRPTPVDIDLMRG